MWRSPEGQTGSGITKASDIFSYGLVVSGLCSTLKVYAKLCLQCIYAFGGGELLLLEDKEVVAELAELGIAPHEDILTRHFTYFGPVNEGLLKQVDSRAHSTTSSLSYFRAFFRT